jgi:hypothetical protein
MVLLDLQFRGGGPVQSSSVRGPGRVHWFAIKVGNLRDFTAPAYCVGRGRFKKRAPAAL